MSATVNAPQFAIGGRRMCGPGRTRGGVYLESGPTPGGVALEHFLMDLPTTMDPELYGIRPLGQTLIQRGGLTHVLDYVGARHYPYPMDFIEEGRRMGFSRKVSPSLELERLSMGSMLIFLHKFGSVDNAPQLAPYVTDFACPCGKGHPPQLPCAAYHAYLPAGAGLNGERNLAEGRYPVRVLAPGAPDPVRVHAQFLAVPLTAITLVQQTDGQVDRKVLRKAQQSGVGVGVVGI